MVVLSSGRRNSGPSMWTGLDVVQAGKRAGEAAPRRTMCKYRQQLRGLKVKLIDIS